MKKIFMIFVAGAALALSSCNNAEEVKKQTEEQDAKITALVDEKLAGLQTQVDEECAALVADSATAAYETWYAAEGKKKGAPKPAAKPKPAAPVEPKKETVGDGKPKIGGDGNPNTVGDGKPKMGGDGKTNTVGSGKPKMGGN